ncbi:MAG: 30S ribosomal protein S6 [candidate division WOR-3 bacterium]|jgi:small subunit ribosomal protein S6
MNNYELAVIIDGNLNEEGVTKIRQELVEMLTGYGAAVTETKIERRAFAYPIRKQREGTYLFINFQAPPTTPERIRRDLLHREEMLRIAIFRLPERKTTSTAGNESAAPVPSAQ